VIATKDQKQRKQIEILDGIGFKPIEIAVLIGTTANNVRVALHSIRKKGKSPKGETEEPSN
jgi:DNA-directed RNA polymerase specialized sigma24 family protein